MAKAFRNRKAVYFCNQCESIFSMNSFRADVAYYCIDNIDGGSYYESADLENVWYCQDGCFHNDEGDSPEAWADEAWTCGECGTIYFDSSSAMDCCL